MSNIDLVIEERSRDIGDFLVGRLLPFRKKRMVGSFIFVDHMGPTSIGPTKYMDVDPHPHIGLSTLTYLLEGEIIHRDSIGSVQRIKPRTVGWMTAGKGVVHTERTPPELRNGATQLVHGYQIWVALPKEKEKMEPEYSFHEQEELPQWEQNGMNMTLIAGEAFGKISPVPVYSPLFMLEVQSEKGGALKIDGEVQGELGIVVVSGSIEACGETIDQPNMLVSKKDSFCEILLQPGTRLFLLGGEPFPEERHIFWNFVASDPTDIENAKEHWKNKKFKMVPEETGYVPLPEIGKGIKPKK